MKQLTAIALALVCAAGSASAQTIERVKMTDNDLSCQQIFNEITQMDAMIARANQPVAATAAAPAPDAGNSDKPALSLLSIYTMLGIVVAPLVGFFFFGNIRFVLCAKLFHLIVQTFCCL